MKAYKGYTGTLEFDEDDLVFHGRIVGIQDTVTYEGETADELVKAFHDSVDDYLAFCTERGKKPEKPFSGKIALRTTPEIHDLVSRAAASDGKSVNRWISDILSDAAAKRIGAGRTRIRS